MLITVTPRCDNEAVLREGARISEAADELIQAGGALANPSEGRMDAY
jgi:hypothetical protein